MAKLAAERESASPEVADVVGPRRDGFSFSAAGAATSSLRRARSVLAARTAPSAVTSTAPGLKWTVMMRPITRPATRSAHAPKGLNGPDNAWSISLPTAPPACAAIANSPTNESTATAPATMSMVRGRGNFGHRR